VVLEIKVKGAEKVQKKLEKVDKGTRMVQKRITRFGAQLMVKEVKAQASGRVVNVRSGRFRRSIKATIDDAKNFAVVGSNVAYAPIIEFGTGGLPGGTIRPNRARFLTVPLPAALTGAGVKRGQARDFADTFVRTNPSTGRTVIYQRRGRDEAIPLFVLVDSVHIKARRPFAIAQKIVQPKIIKFAEAAMRKVVKDA